MASLELVGPAGVGANAVSRLKYVNDKKATALTQVQVDDRITTLLTGYATKAQVDAGDAGAATVSYVDQQDLLRVPKSWLNLANGGPATLTGGKVTTSQYTATGSQRYIKKMYSPTSYGSQKSVTTETTLYTVSIADPGWPYWIQAWGWNNVSSNTAGVGTVIRVRVGSTSGTIIAQGYSRQSNQKWSECTFVPIYWGGTAALTGATTVYVTAARSGSSGTVTVASLLANTYIQVQHAN